MSPGVCLDALNPAGAPTIDELRASGADGARLVAFNDDAFFGYQRMLEHAGLTTAVVLASESFPDSDYRSWAGWYAARCTPTYWVLGNEPDGYLLPGSDPSWAMQPESYAAFWTMTAAGIRSLQPETRLCLAGLVAGQPWWLENILPLLDLQPDAVDIHPYGKNEFQAQTLIGQYADVAGPDIGLLVLEWHRSASEIPGYIAMLQASADWSCFFAWHDVDGLGLHDAAGNPRPEYHAFKAATGGIMAIDVGPGVLAKMSASGDHPLTDEEFHTNKDGSTWSRTLGTRGWYFAGNATGNWEVVGPFPAAA